MCGIFGTTLKYNNQELEDKLARANFRGPDYQSIQRIPLPTGETLSLGHNRLSIIDLDARSNQPFNYHDKVTVVFNGEIYNFRSLKEVLEKRGHSFKTTSDTEVLCAAYLEFGENCVEHVNGMFAFVIYDHHKQLLFGARDRLGQKPFYYYKNGQHFEFASQVSQIKMYNQNLSISYNSIMEYLRWGSIPDNLSIYNEIKKIKPGFKFTFDLSSGQFVETQYWDIPTENSDNYKKSLFEAKEELKELLYDATKIRLYADVPVGVFLSGGIDSSLIAALARKSVGEHVKTFSIKFSEQNFDESEYAKQVADHLGTNHHTILCDSAEGIDLIENFNRYYDEPFADSSAIPSMLLAKNTRKHVTVALSGDGGDESFIGYRRYRWTSKVAPIYKVSFALRKPMAQILRLFPGNTLKYAAEGISKVNIEELYLSTLSNIDLSWIDYEWKHDEAIEKEYLFHQNKNLLERISDFDLKTYLNWDINTKVDRATMSTALEARSPLMDYRVVEFARKLPTSFKFGNNTQKRILKEVLYDFVPEKVFDRPKAGFTMPFETWFRTDLKDMVLSELRTEELESIPGINSNIVQQKITEHMKGERNRAPLIWKLLVLKKWLKEERKGITIS